ncbi:MAG TPA: hypothetical protein VLN26_09400 [Gaiellaceae bacterium]|nr:hypothetical protein [Gaiellaceae bacterium]
MKRILLLALLAALAAAPTALAKRTRLAVVPPTAPATVRAPWTPRIVVRLDGRPYRGAYRPELGLLDRTGSVIRLFASRPTGTPGVYAVDVVFPRPGLWRYWIHDPIMGGWYFTVRVGA